MQFNYGLLADEIIDGQNGKKNIIGLFKSIAAFAYPCKHSRMTLIFSLEVNNQDVGQHTLEMSIVDSNNHPIKGHEKAEMKFQANSPGEVEGIMRIEGLVLPKPDVYQVIIRVNHRHLGEVQFRALKIQAPEQSK